MIPAAMISAFMTSAFTGYGAETVTILLAYGSGFLGLAWMLATTQRFRRAASRRLAEEQAREAEASQ